jgi:type IV secretory pathway VirB2 component (pilin)
MIILKRTVVALVAVLAAIAFLSDTTEQAVETSKAGLEQCLDKMAASLKG